MSRLFKPNLLSFYISVFVCINVFKSRFSHLIYIGTKEVGSICKPSSTARDICIVDICEFIDVYYKHILKTPIQTTIFWCLKHRIKFNLKVSTTLGRGYVKREERTFQFLKWVDTNFPSFFWAEFCDLICICKIKCRFHCMYIRHRYL